MSSVLRVYLPEECEAWTAAMERGPRPLDWDSCRACDATGKVPIGMTGLSTCSRCGGHGSLRAAALAGRLAWAAGEEAFPGGVRDVRLRDGRMRAVLDAAEYGEGADVDASDGPTRCEGCGHPMSDGTWDPGGLKLDIVNPEEAVRLLRAGKKPETTSRCVHWSPCDEGCRHDMAHTAMGGVARTPWDTGQSNYVMGETCAAWPGKVHEASWRQVDVRTLGWAFDLSPGNLAVLCLRCWASREPA